MNFKLIKQMKTLLESIDNYDIASDPNTDQEELRDLLLNNPKDYELSKKLVANPNSPQDLLYLLSNRDKEHADLFWNNPATELLRLDDPGKFNKNVASQIQKNPNNLHPKTMLVGALSNDTVAHNILVGDKNTPEEYINHIAMKTPSNDLKIKIASKANASPEALDHIMKSVTNLPESDVNRSILATRVFQNKNTTSDTLDHALNNKLYHNGNIYDLLIHKNMAPDILNKYAKDENYNQIHDLIAKHPSVSPETLHILAQSPNITIRKIVARNSDTPRETLKMLTKDWHTGVKKEAENTLSAY